jgi:hypothetical protein
MSRPGPGTCLRTGSPGRATRSSNPFGIIKSTKRTAWLPRKTAATRKLPLTWSFLVRSSRLGLTWAYAGC